STISIFEIHLVNLKHTKSPTYNYFCYVAETHLVNLKPQIYYLYTLVNTLSHNLFFLLKNSFYSGLTVVLFVFSMSKGILYLNICSLQN
ncbi:MAG: hypothetical protein ACLS8D_18815, partial [Clostridioides difficile]